MARRGRNRGVDSYAKRPDSRGPVPSPIWRPSKRILVPLIVFAGLICAYLSAYWPAITGGYIWDDDSYVTGNTLLRSAAGLGKIWFEPNASPQYYPVVFTSFWIEYHFWQLRPLGYHLVNVFLHAGNALLIWLILRRLSVQGAWLAAAIFAFHPVHVESVAWITERKNVLSALFYLTALCTYLSISLDGQTPWQGARWWRRYVFSNVLYLAALLSKSVTCSLPAVILLLLWWKRGTDAKDDDSSKHRLTIHDVTALLPMFVIGLALGLHTVHQEKFHVGAVGPEWNLSYLDRILLAGRISCFYVAKLILPSRLAFIYPRWTIDSAVWWQFLFPLGMILTTAALWMMRRRIGKGPLIALLFFVGTLTPALGFFNVFPMRFSYVADHFQYLASIGPITMSAVLLARWLGGLPMLTGNGEVNGPATRFGQGFVRAFPGVVLVPLAVVTWRQAHTYKDVETLWRDTIATNPSAWIAYNNLAHQLINESKYAEAAPYLREALKLNPDYPEALFSLCGALTEQSPPDAARIEEAIAICRRGLEVRPNTPLGYNNLCRALSKLGRNEEAIAQGLEAIRLRPGWDQAHTDLGFAYWRAQDYEKGLAHLQKAVELSPQNANTHYNLAVALNQLGNVDGAITQLSNALQLAPDLENAKRMLARLIARKNQGQP